MSEVNPHVSNIFAMASFDDCIGEDANGDPQYDFAEMVEVAELLIESLTALKVIDLPSASDLVDEFIVGQHHD